MKDVNYKEILKLKNMREFISTLNSVAVPQYNNYIDIYERRLNDNIDLDNMKNYLLCLDRAYMSNVSPIRDEEYDRLHSIYEELSHGNVIRGDMISDTKVTHAYPDLKGTIRKCHYITESDRIKKSRIKTHKSLEKWIIDCLNMLPTYESHKLMFSPKFDGVSIIFEIDNGVVKSAITRGDIDLSAGNDKTRLFKNFRFDESKEGNDKYGLKCEAIMSESDFNKYNKKYGNNELVDERSAVNSILSTDSTSVDQMIFIQLKPLMYEVNNICVPIESEKDSIIIDEYAKVSKNMNSKNIIDILNKGITKVLKKINSCLDVKCDGIVIRFSDQEDMKILGRDYEACVNNYERAYKFPPAQVRTVLEDVSQEIGYLGNVSFIAKVKPVKIKNKIIKSISLGSKDRFESLNLHKGDEVIVKYDIIPYLEKDESCKENSDGDLFKTITCCPICNEELIMNPELMCPNSSCPSRVIGKIYNYCKKMKIENIGEETICTLFYNGILTDISSLYKLDNDEIKEMIINLDGFGKKKYKIIIDSIKKIKSVPSWVLFGSLGIPGVGRKIFKRIFEFISWNEIYDKINDKRSLLKKLTEIPGIKDKMATKVVDGFKENINLIDNILKHIKLSKDKKGVGIIVFTGFRNNEFEKYLENLGYTIGELVTKDTTLLIADSLSNESTKITKAKKFNIPIIDKNEAFIKFKY